MSDAVQLILTLILGIITLILGFIAFVGAAIMGVLMIPLCGITGDLGMCQAAEVATGVIGWVALGVGGLIVAVMFFFRSDRIFAFFRQLFSSKPKTSPEYDKYVKEYDEWIATLPALRKLEASLLWELEQYIYRKRKPTKKIIDLFLNAVRQLSPIAESSIPARPEYPDEGTWAPPVDSLYLFDVGEPALRRFFGEMENLYDHFFRGLPDPAFLPQSDTDGLAASFSSLYTDNTRMIDALYRGFQIETRDFKTDSAAFSTFRKYPIRLRYEAAMKERDFDNVQRLHYVIKGTPFEPLLSVEFPFGIPDEKFDEHGFILGPQGSGKTQTIQYFVSNDLLAVERNERTVVVMDSSGDLIKNIRNLKIFTGALRDKLLILEPDIEHPLALNPFAMGKDRREGYSPRAREQLGNAALDLLTYIFSALGEGAEFTPKQSALYRYCIRLLMEIPEATLHTFVEILQQGTARYSQYVEALDPTARTFFESQFTDTKQFGQTKQEVAWRLALMLENRVFDRMFSSPDCRVDLFTELSSSKVILINTDKALLGPDQTALLGRFWIAMIMNATNERATISREERLPVRFYVDEFHDYKADPKVPIILDTARKMRIGMMVATQRTANIGNTNVLDALLTTSIKFAHTDNPVDTGVMAKAMHTTSEFIRTQPKEHFAVHVRGVTDNAVSLRIPFFVMEKMEKMTAAEQQGIMEDMWERYSVGGKAQKPEAPEPSDQPEWKKHAREEIPRISYSDDPDNVDMSAR